MSIWWHGGPTFSGDVVLPPSMSGAETLDDVLPDALEAEAAAVRDRDKVYVVNDRNAALLYACVWSTGRLYLVQPHGELEPDPDFFGGCEPLLSMRCASARIIRRESVSAAERAMVTAALRGAA